MLKVKAVKKPIPVTAYQTDKKVIIHSLEGNMTAQPNDWILTGINNEQWVVRNDIFKKTYDIISYLEDN